MKEIELEEKQREEISYLPFPKGKIPCEAEFDYQGQSFLLVFFYNEAYDFLLPTYIDWKIWKKSRLS
ncbi:hypothetical protein C3V36_14630 [Lachnospiraceae bacterium oral taxon 500]|nr:hypothetical protein C3V36_14630 [Lachnospiraceae bacterium oral taxon 500]